MGYALWSMKYLFYDIVYFTSLNKISVCYESKIHNPNIHSARMFEGKLLLNQ